MLAPVIALAAAVGAALLWTGARRGSSDLAKRLAQAVREAADARRDREALAERLEAQADWHAMTLASIADAVIRVDPAGRVRSMNAQAEALTGWLAADAIGRSLEEVFVVEPAVAAVSAERSAAHTERPETHSDGLLVTRAGERRLVHHARVPIAFHDGREPGAVLTFHDVSAQREAYATRPRLREATQSAERTARLAQAELHAAHEKFAAFMANFPYPAFIQDDAGEFVLMNAAAEASAAWKAAARGIGQPPESVAQTVSSAEDDRHYFCIRFPLAIDGRSWLGGIAIDISEGVRTERALSERTAEFETLFRSVPAPLWIARDARGGDIVGNAAANLLVGAAPGEPQARVLRDAMPVPAHELPIAVAVRERRNVHGTDMEFVRPDGTRRRVRVTAAPLFDAKGGVRGAVAAGLDITQLKTFEAELEQAVRRRDEFLAVLAHELRNPLAPIRNSVEILHRVPHDVERVRRATATIERQISLVERLIDDLVDVARISQGIVELDLAPRGVRAIVDGAVAVVAAAADKSGHVLEVDHGAAAAVVLVDALRAEQVVVNVLSNALKYSLPRTRVAVRTHVEGEYARIAVVDEGQGILQEHLSEIFTMFARPGVEPKSGTGGMGVGLALAKQLCEQQRGSIEARSDGRGRGATFTISFPLARAAASEAA